MTSPFIQAVIVVLGALLLSLPSYAQPVADSSPLQPCPDTPNCERTQRTYDTDPDTLFSATRTALNELGPTSIEVQEAARTAHAVYRVALVFKDDVHVAVTAGESAGSILHVRSASRVGYSDLGVNARRVERFFDAVDTALPQ
ncbi:MAG: DUF1499 domain-containing protein [Bacteroidetes bacterium]|jgi:uncharacterized protein (DUF1499 family)|nr:DUF1499 domain-containing protein [Bacteroidota bacterium]